AGILRPEAAIGAHLRAAQWCDADLRCGAAVHDWQADPDGIRVIVDDEVISAATLVLTPGPWAAKLTRLNLPMRVQRRVQHYWRASDPALLSSARLPVWIWEYGPGQMAYGLPEVDSGGIKAALHHGAEAVDPDEGAQPARTEEIAYLRDWLAGHLPTLADGGWLRSEPCLYTLTPDEHFVLGHHPQHANVVVACGFSGHGFKFSPVVGEIIADLVSTGSTGHPIGLFDPTRFSSVGGAR
ncbi:MAG TPA: FAD-dependent oxidoreductase, partial [Micromonosporaceae bacterium]